jgi:murein DD-endopeptidase MepM/ murein hydrolase activator NlpD
VRAKLLLKQENHSAMKRFLIVLAILVVPLLASAGTPTITLYPKKAGPGDVLIVTVTGAAKIGPGNLGGRPLHFNVVGGRQKAVIGIDLNAEPGRYRLSVTADGRRLDRTVRIVKKKYPVQRLTLPEDKVTLTPENEARADREQKELSEIWPVDSARLWSGRFINPLPGKEMTTPFGVRRIINGIPKNPHSGIDLAAEVGEPVRAPNDGVVVVAEEQFFSGNSIVLDHGQGIYTMFFHLSSMKVRSGQAVMKGDVIGLTGATGRVTGPCLHWGARIEGAKVDPLQLIKLKLD